MLPFRNRLVKRKDFAIIQKKGLFFHQGGITLKVLANQQMETRVGIVAGMSFSKKAVERNQAKRQLRELIKGRLGQMKKGYDVVVMVRNPKGDKISSQVLHKDLEDSLQQAELLSQNNNQKP
jgi:ribonuclease P protein component